MRDCVRLSFAVWLTAIVIVPAPAQAAEIKVLSDGPLRPALTRIADSFRRDTGHAVQFIFGLSPVIHKKVIDGEPGDVVIIQPDFVEELVKAGRVLSGQHPIIGRVGIGLFGRADAAARDTSTPETLRQVLLSADSIVFNNVASGNAFAKIIDGLSMTETVKNKIIRTSPAEVNKVVLEGKGNEIGVGTVPLIVAEKTLKLIGVLPPELQSYIVYAAVPMTSSQSREVANEFIRFLGLPETRKEFAAAGVN